jgi:excisionase family DNA binding protein
MSVLFDSHSVATIIPDAKWYLVEGKVGNMNEHLVTISTPAPAESQAVTRKRRRDPSDSDWISPHDAANILGTDAKNIRRMIRSGKLPAMRDGGRWLVLRKNVERQ